MSIVTGVLTRCVNNLAHGFHDVKIKVEAECDIWAAKGVAEPRNSSWDLEIGRCHFRPWHTPREL